MCRRPARDDEAGDALRLHVHGRQFAHLTGADAVFDKETELDQFIAFCQGLSEVSAAGLG